MLVQGEVSQAKLQQLRKEILNLIHQQNPKSIDSQSLEIKLQVVVLHNITKWVFFKSLLLFFIFPITLTQPHELYNSENLFREPVTKILYTYSCSQCDLEDDQVKDSVKSALQTFNLKEYEGETTDKKAVDSDKVCTYYTQ